MWFVLEDGGVRRRMEGDGHGKEGVQGMREGPGVKLAEDEGEGVERRKKARMGKRGMLIGQQSRLFGQEEMGARKRVEGGAHGKEGVQESGEGSRRDGNEGPNRRYKP